MLSLQSVSVATSATRDAHANMQATDEPITSLSALLAECNLSHLCEPLSSDTLALADTERTELLATLKARGVSKLGERQACATAMGKAKRLGRLLPGSPLDVPPGSSGVAPAITFAAAPSEPLSRKPRIALLHGGATNPKIFDFQLKQLSSRVKEDFDLLHIPGHRVVNPGDNPMALMMKKVFGPLAEQLLEYAPTSFDQRGWWRYQATCDTALRNLEQSLAEAGEVDFLLGFSQGANFATMLAARAKMSLPGSRPPFRGIILLEPDLPGWVYDQPGLFHAGPLPIPAVVVGAMKHEAPEGSPAPPHGPAPPAVINTAADEVAKLLENPMVLKFDEGHRPLPANKERAADIVEAIRAFVSERCGGDAGAVQVS